MRRIPIPALTADDLTDQIITLPDEAAHYARDVLRLAPPSEHLLFDGQGRTLHVRLIECTADAVTALVLQDQHTTAGESPLRTILHQAIPKGERWEWVLEKSVELGVTQIWPLHTARSVVRIPHQKAAQKIERWQKLLTSATRQCGRAITPNILAPQELKAAIKSAPQAPHILHLICHPPKDMQTPRFDPEQETFSEVHLWVGPEGGFAPDELDALEHLGPMLTVGPRILRSETAGIALLTLVQHWFGDLR